MHEPRNADPEVELICLRQKTGLIHVELCACQAVGICPSCGGRSFRVHSRCWRTIADLPWQGIPVQILLRARMFFCGEERCQRRIFTEPLPGTVSCYARRSNRSSEALSCLCPGPESKRAEMLAAIGKLVHGHPA
ncbi:MAG: transposase family protein [Janthinobacterium lividum]